MWLRIKFNQGSSTCILTLLPSCDLSRLSVPKTQPAINAIMQKTLTNRYKKNRNNGTCLIAPKDERSQTEVSTARIPLLVCLTFQSWLFASDPVAFSLLHVWRGENEGNTEKRPVSRLKCRSGTREPLFVGVMREAGRRSNITWN